MVVLVSEKGMLLLTPPSMYRFQVKEKKNILSEAWGWGSLCFEIMGRGLSALRADRGEDWTWGALFAVVKTVHPRMSDGVCGYGLYEGV